MTLHSIGGLARPRRGAGGDSPEGEAEARHRLPGVDFRADILVIMTEWDQFRALHLEQVRTLTRTPVRVDLRNICKPADVRALGFRYASAGRA